MHRRVDIPEFVFVGLACSAVEWAIVAGHFVPCAVVVVGHYVYKVKVSEKSIDLRFKFEIIVK